MRNLFWCCFLLLVHVSGFASPSNASNSKPSPDYEAILEHLKSSKVLVMTHGRGKPYTAAITDAFNEEWSLCPWYPVNQATSGAIRNKDKRGFVVLDTMRYEIGGTAGYRLSLVCWDPTNEDYVATGDFKLPYESHYTASLTILDQLDWLYLGVRHLQAQLIESAKGNEKHEVFDGYYQASGFKASSSSINLYEKKVMIWDQHLGERYDVDDLDFVLSDSLVSTSTLEQAEILSSVVMKDDIFVAIRIRDAFELYSAKTGIWAGTIFMYAGYRAHQIKPGNRDMSSKGCLRWVLIGLSGYALLVIVINIVEWLG